VFLVRLNAVGGVMADWIRRSKPLPDDRLLTPLLAKHGDRDLPQLALKASPHAHCDRSAKSIIVSTLYDMQAHDPPPSSLFGDRE
jgi:hypothetical protein